MSVNRYKPYLIVIPEDRAIKEIAVGFFLHANRQVQVLAPQRGWHNVVDELLDVYCTELTRYPLCHIALLIDFDNQDDRRAKILERVPEGLASRVYILGSLAEPEDLRRTFGNYEHIGSTLVDECLRQQPNLWNDRLLAHNLAELDRMRQQICPIVFTVDR